MCVEKKKTKLKQVMESPSSFFLPVGGFINQGGLFIFIKNTPATYS